MRTCWLRRVSKSFARWVTQGKTRDRNRERTRGADKHWRQWTRALLIEWKWHYSSKGKCKNKCFVDAARERERKTETIFCTRILLTFFNSLCLLKKSWTEKLNGYNEIIKMQVYNIYTVQWSNKVATDTEDPKKQSVVRGRLPEILEDMPSHFIEIEKNIQYISTVCLRACRIHP